MKKLLLDLSDDELFGNEAGEEEDPDILASYFVEKKMFKKFYSPKRRLAIIRARKGMGKSALLSKVAHDIKEDDPGSLVIFLDGSDLVELDDFELHDPLVLVNRWQRAICKMINLHIGATLKMAMFDDGILMVEGAELAGFKRRNILGSLLDRIKLPNIGSVEKCGAAVGATNLLRTYLSRRDGLRVWLLVDDIDSTFLNRQEERLRISTFFSAVRKMVSDFKGINIRVSVRTDVWSSIIRADEAMDKCEQYAEDLLWSSRETGRILSKKILSYVQRNAPGSKVAREWSVEDHGKELLNLVFTHSLEWAGEHLPPNRPVHLLSAGRPRWSAQLCRLAGHRAADVGAKRITIGHIDDVLKPFGKLRLDDIHREHTHQFPGIQGLTEAFAGGGSIYYTSELLSVIWDKYIMKIGGLDEVPRLDGFLVSRPLDLAHFLYKIGFISARARDRFDNISFIKYEERPDLLSNAVNPDDGLRWDIHPSYRKHLRIVRGSAVAQPRSYCS